MTDHYRGLPIPEGYFLMGEVRDRMRPMVESDWGNCFLVKTEAETSYCSCEHCQGHETTHPLPESEYYWKASVRPMLMPIFEQHSSALFDLISKLGKSAP